jgi:LysR family hca operon transcriptional activator
MELRHLRYFVAVAEQMSISRAAERLHTAQPSLGRQIRQLESLLNTSLLTRNRHRWELTEAGMALLKEAKRILHELDSTVLKVQQAGHEEAGRIVAGFSPGASSAVLSRLLPLLKARHPEIHLVLRSLYSEEQVAAILDRSITVGFLRGPVGDPQIASEVIRRDRMMALIPSRHPLARLKQVPVEKLARLPLILSRTFREDLDSLAARAGVKFNMGLETDNILPTLSAVGAGLGFSVLPDHYEQILPKTVASRPLALTPAPTVDLVVAYRSGEIRPVLASFLAVVRSCFRKKQA